MFFVPPGQDPVGYERASEVDQQDDSAGRFQCGVVRRQENCRNDDAQAERYSAQNEFRQQVSITHANALHSVVR